jgi:hypothetical protein
MITAETRGLFKTHREAEKRQTKDARTAKTEAGKRAASPTDVLVDPMVTLGLSEHQCRLVTELHLGKKNMTKLHPSITTFSNLEELWVNDNRLKRVVGLLPAPGTVALSDGARGCNRLKRLYASNNVISSLEGDLTRLRYLEVLLLANNRLSNMELVSQQLASLRFLKQLDLFGNPLAEEQNYRLYLIHQHPQLELLDRRSVLDEERREAAALFAAGGLATLGGVSAVAAARRMPAPTQVTPRARRSAAVARCRPLPPRPWRSSRACRSTTRCRLSALCPAPRGSWRRR